MKKLRKRIGIATLFAMPIALAASLATNLIDTESTSVLDEVMTLNSHEGGVNGHENDGNSWISLTAEYVDSTQDGESEGEVPGSTEEGGMTYYYLDDDLELDSYNITITGNVTLCLNGNVLRGNGSSSVIIVSEDANLTLHDCKYENTDYPHRYYINNYRYMVDNGTLDWEDNYIAAFLEDSSTVGTIYGGVITGGSTSNGAGIYVYGTFTMHGGTIAGNYATTSAAGVYVATDATFDMYDGAISGNRLRNGYGAGVYIGAGEATFNMHNGIISNNYAPSNGGGVYINVGTGGYFNMYNGTIANNRTGANGGGVILYAGTFVMEGGEIINNYAESGGGVYLYNSSNASFTMKDGTISYNTAATSYGGGVYANTGTFFMEGGTIENNNATENGGGVYVSGSGTFTLSGGTVSNNKLNEDDNDVYVDSGLTFNMTNGYLGSLTNWGNVSISGGYLSFDPTDYSYLADNHVALNIANLGGKDYDDAYVEGFDYAVYMDGGVSVQDGVIEDFTTCADVNYVDDFQINISYSSASYYCITTSSDYLPTEEGVYEVVATLYEALSVNADGDKIYNYALITSFVVTINSHVQGNAVQENVDPATCTEDGSYDAVIYCTECSNKISSTPQTITALGHSATYDSGEPATTTETGLLEHWYCSVCETYFLDEACTEEAEYEDLIIPMLEEEDTGSGTGGDVSIEPDTNPDTGSDTSTGDDTGDDTSTGDDTGSDTNPDTGSDVDVEPEYTTDGEGLSGGAIAGIIIGVLVVVGGGAFLTFYLLKRKKIENVEADSNEDVKAKEEAKAEKLAAKEKAKEEKAKLKEEKKAEKAKLKEEKAAEKAKAMEEKDS